MTSARSYRGRRVVVTGAAGFVGANASAALAAEGAEVHALVRPGCTSWRLAHLPHAELHEVDLTDQGAVVRTLVGLRPECVFHLAAYSAYAARPDEQMRLRVDVGGTLAVLEGAREAGCRRLVHAGSSLEYGPYERPIGEDLALRPVVHRGVTKAAATLAVLRAARARGDGAVVLRLFSVYGPWEHPHRLVPSAVRAAWTGEVLPLTGSGLRHDLVYADDVADALLRAGLEPGACGEAINIGSGEQHANEEVVDLVARAAGAPVRREVGAFAARDCDTGCWVADIRKAERLLGWRPATSLARGIERTVSWWAGRRDLFGAGR